MSLKSIKAIAVTHSLSNEHVFSLGTRNKLKTITTDLFSIMSPLRASDNTVSELINNTTVSRHGGFGRGGVLHE